MFFAKAKKYVGLALAFSIVLGCFIFNPERAKAESFLVLGKDYYLSEHNYSYCFGDYCAAIRFVPAETGYYLLDTDVYFDCFWFSEWAVNEDGTPKGYVYYDSKDNVQYFNLQLEYDPYKQQVYYFQKGYDYYFVHPKTGCYGADEGGFCLKRIEDYFQLRHNFEVDVIKDSSFECWASIVTTVECENVSFQWYKNHGEVLKTDTNSVRL